MAKVIGDRVAAEIEGDFVVFLIGMRVNKLWKVGKWMPVAKAMGVMLKELYASDREQTGFPGHQPLSMFNMVQYWRSFDHLEAYARSQDDAHWPAWVAFNRAMKGAREDVGIWHETYQIRAGEYECIYGTLAFRFWETQPTWSMEHLGRNRRWVWVIHACVCMHVCVYTVSAAHACVCVHCICSACMCVCYNCHHAKEISFVSVSNP